MTYVVMKYAVRITTLLFLCATGAIRAADDNSRVEALWTQFVESWNRHDVRAFSLLFSLDADMTNWRGEHIRGQAAIRERYQPLFSGVVFQDSVVSGKVRLVRFLRPDIAVVDVDWEMSGARTADGAARPNRQGILDLVCEKQGGDWRIVVFHDTDFTAASRPPK